MAYVGMINDQNVDHLFDIANEKTVTEFIVSSGGGKANTGVNMGQWVYDDP